MTPGPPLVLVADDEPQLLKVVIRVLEKNGYPVATATDGAEAVRLLQTGPDEINVAVVDAAIAPDGADAVLEVIASERPRVGIVVISGGTLDPSLRDQLIAVDGIFLRKPFPPVALLRAVEDSLIKEDS